MTETTQWHTASIAELESELEVAVEHGLTAHEAAERRRIHGANVLPEPKPDGFAVLFFRQFQSPLIGILFLAAGIVWYLGEVTDAVVIAAVLIFNAVVGMIQEGRSQNTLRALRHLSAASAVVVRDGVETIIVESEIVPGDVIALTEGARVGADARLIKANALRVDESAFTGESGPIHKRAEPIALPHLPTTEQKNMVWKGTHVVGGSGEAVVVATGTTTEIGKITKTLAEVKHEIPLRTDVRNLSRLIVGVVGAVVAALFFFGLAREIPARTIFSTAISLAVSIIPEGLPVVLTLVLSTGVWRMAKRHAIVKRLQAVEALGQAKVLALDKTGTLTKNEMVAQRAVLRGRKCRIGGEGYAPTGEITCGEVVVDPADDPELLMAGKIAAYSSGADVAFDNASGVWKITGDPTEAALMIFGKKIGFHKDKLEAEHPRVAEIPFDYHTKFHATIHKGDGKFFTAVAGAPEAILVRSRLEMEERTHLGEEYAAMGREGFRTIALAFREDADARMARPEDVQGLTFVGFLGLQDSLRAEAREAVIRARAAGLRVVMLTGDHKVTAVAIAREAGIYPQDAHEDAHVVTGSDIEALGIDGLAERLGNILVFARVTPEHKLKIIQAFRRRGEIVAMTGDGVNDAPSLVAADLGIAMGKIGTEVAKEAADIVLMDENFSTIVSAIEEGRNIYITIKKVLLYLFSTSAGEVLTIAGALAVGLPLPILAPQILWLNLVTDGFLDIALALEPKDRDLLARPFARPNRYLVDRLMLGRMAVMAIPMAVGSIMVFAAYAPYDLPRAWTVALTTLAIFQWFNAWNCRSDRASLFETNPGSNWFLAGATMLVIVLQAMAVYTPFFQRFLHTVPLALVDWMVAFGVGSTIIAFEEVRKYLVRVSSLYVRSRRAD